MMMKNSIRYQALMTNNGSFSSKEAQLARMYEMQQNEANNSPQMKIQNIGKLARKMNQRGGGMYSTQLDRNGRFMKDIESTNKIVE